MHTSPFLQNLMIIKIGLVVFLCIAAIVYQIIYVAMFDKQNPTLRGLNNTYINNPTTVFRIVKESSVTAFIGFLMVFVIKVSRYGINMQLVSFSSLKTYFVVGFILALFAFSQESSGFNRWLADPEDYKAINTNSMDAIVAENAGGAPFIRTTAYTSFVLVALGMCVCIVNMFRYTFKGFKSGANPAPIPKFLIEIVIMAILGALSPILTVVVREEKFKPMTGLSIAFYVATSVVLHVMFQYNGEYSTETAVLQTKSIGEATK